jgi:hypothetical protein
VQYCGPLSLLVAEVFLMEQEIYLETFEYDSEDIRLLRLYHNDVMLTSYKFGQVSLFNKSSVPMSSTPKKIEETADIPCQLLRKLFKSK